MMSTTQNLVITVSWMMARSLYPVVGLIRVIQGLGIHPLVARLQAVITQMIMQATQLALESPLGVTTQPLKRLLVQLIMAVVVIAMMAATQVMGLAIIMAAMTAEVATAAAAVA
jgi:hypothetical protein